jgi:hypothetical protein
MTGAIGGALWRSPPPLRLRYGVDVDSTRLEEAHGLFSRADSLSHNFASLYPFGNNRKQGDG